MRWLWVIIAALASACSGSTAAPSPTPNPIPTPSPSTFTVTGHVTATNGGQPLSGITVTMGSATATTDAGGTFSTSMSLGTVRVTLASAGILARSVTAAVNGARDLPLEAIALGGGFDPTFYRQFVRNGYETPMNLRALARWTQNPSIYLRTVDDTGIALDTATLAATETAIREAVPMWTTGRFTATIERGTDTREGLAGWITVKWQSTHNLPTSETGFCGNSFVGINPNVINLRYAGVCRCPGTEIRPMTVRHEIGHAMGFWHTGNAADLMSGLSISGCDLLPSARERYHAAIAYSRPVGNTDPDNDPTSVVNLAPMRVY